MKKNWKTKIKSNKYLNDIISYLILIRRLEDSKKFKNKTLLNTFFIKKFKTINLYI